MTTKHPVVVYDVQLSEPERTANTPPNFRDSPLEILRYDLGLILRHAAEIPFIFLPLPRSDTKQRDINFVGFLIQAAFLIISLVVTGVVCSAFTIGMPVPIVGTLILVFTVKGITKAQGKVRAVEDEKYEDEAWLFVNGIATSASGLQLILDELHGVFHRRVTGIHNKTYGIWWDLVECLLQRDLLWPTEDVRVGYQTICRYITDPTKKKVVLMAHSQGGIIMSRWVAQLLADFNAEDLQKVEIYTFASAANRFAIPSTTIATGERRFVFGIVEHFVNTRDYVSLIGLIEFAPAPPEDTVPGVLPQKAADGRFAGRIFKRLGHTGHLFVNHYIQTGDSILDDPTVVKNSQLCKYKDGKRADAELRVWRDTEETKVPAVIAHPIQEGNF